MRICNYVAEDLRIIAVNHQLVDIDRVFSKERHSESCNEGVADKIVIGGTRDLYFVCSVSAGEIEDFSDSGLVWLFSYNNSTASNIGESTSDKLRSWSKFL